jgi:hypothetical protein
MSGNCRIDEGFGSDRLGLRIMDDALFIGTAREISVENILSGALENLRECGFRASEQELLAVKVSDGRETPHDGGMLLEDSFIKIVFRGRPDFVSICKFKTDVVRGFSQITDPYTVGVAVWVGAEPECRLLAGCVACAVAVSAGAQILDSELKWTDKEMNGAAELLDALKERFRQATPPN